MIELLKEMWEKYKEASLELKLFFIFIALMFLTGIIGIYVGIIKVYEAGL